MIGLMLDRLFPSQHGHNNKEHDDMHVPAPLHVNKHGVRCLGPAFVTDKKILTCV